MVQVKKIPKEYGANQILTDASFTLDKKEKITVVGK
jgi:ABC-type polar amino acid transport system ATPase subunit